MQRGKPPMNNVKGDTQSILAYEFHHSLTLAFEVSDGKSGEEWRDVVYLDSSLASALMGVLRRFLEESGPMESVVLDRLDMGEDE